MYTVRQDGRISRVDVRHAEDLGSDSCRRSAGGFGSEQYVWLTIAEPVGNDLTDDGNDVGVNAMVEKAIHFDDIAVDCGVIEHGFA